MKEIVFLGHIISEKSIKVDLEKIKAVSEWKQPENITEIKSEVFLDWRDITIDSLKEFSKIAKPLTQLLKKDNPFEWTDKYEKEFSWIGNKTNYYINTCVTW